MSDFILSKKTNLDTSHRPTLQSLSSAIRNLSSSYHQKINTPSYLSFIQIWGGDPERDRLVKFIELMNNETDENKEFIHTFAYAIKYGSLLYLMIQMNKKYQLRGPENNYLYQECQHILSLTTPNALTNELLTHYLEAINQFITGLLLNKKKIMELENSGLSQATLFLKEMKKNIDQQLTHNIEF